MVVNCFKQALRVPVVVVQKYNIIGVNEIKYINVLANLNTWVALRGLTTNPVDDVLEEGIRECSALSNAGAYHKRQ